MATTATLTRFSRALPLLAGATVVGYAGTRYFATGKPLLLDATAADASKLQISKATSLLSFPRTMAFSKQLTVAKVEQVNHDTKRITFQLPGGSGEISGVAAGGAILTQHTPSGHWFPVFRPYTPISAPDEHGFLRLLVKKYPGGVASGHLHSLERGQQLTVRGPLPTGYSYSTSAQPRDVLFVAGGAGITPIYSLARRIASDPSDKTNVHVVWGVNGTRDIVLKQELEQLEQQYPGRLRVTYCVSGPEANPDAPSLGDETKWRKGYVNSAVLNEVVQGFKSGTWGDAKGTKVFLCGPPAMEKALEGATGVFSQLGADKKSIHKF